MGQLHRDAYYEFAHDRAWDLATGDEVSLRQVLEAPVERVPALCALTDVFGCARDGEPQWVVAQGRGGCAAIRDVAAEARAHGFVPIAVPLYRQIVSVVAPEIVSRALCLIAPAALPLDVARGVLLDAAARSPRPHVLVTFAAGPTPPVTRGPYLVREARSVYAAHGVRARPAGDELPVDVRQHLGRASRAEEFVRCGRHAAAERLLRDVTAALARRRAMVAAAEISVSLGRLQLERGRAADADGTFAEAARLAELGADDRLAVRARLWQAAARTDLGRLTAAESMCRAAALTGQAGPELLRHADAGLARVLVWQQRPAEAATLSVVATEDAADPAYVRATVVRVLLACDRLFEAGELARRLIDATSASADPIARLVAAIAHLRVLVQTGDLQLAGACMHDIEAAARDARSPLRLARARLIYVDALRRAGREPEAARVLKQVERMRAAAPPLLRDEIDRRLRRTPSQAPQGPPPLVTVPRAATAMITLVQREEQDRRAIEQLVDYASTVIDASRLDLWSDDAGPGSVILSRGGGVPTRLGARCLDAGITIGPEPVDAGHEVAVPVRLGTRVMAALTARWPVTKAPPPHSAELLELAAAVVAGRLESMLAAARETARAATLIPELVGVSAAMNEVRRAVARAAAAPFSVLIEGESGVGKELVARAIHQLGVRRERRFCDVNCAALPDDLIEAELFGYARGAFTGAVAERAGLIEEADGGTLFLDEIADLSARAQAKLLRAVQQQEVRRVGETFSRTVDVRFVAAANRDLRAEASAGRFRPDLLYRLDVIRIRIPPLRDRPEDVPLLAAHFWRAAAARVGTTATLSPAVQAQLARYAWPGNVRELQNVMAALAVDAPARGVVRPGALPPALSGAAPAVTGSLAEARARFERRYVETALARCGSNRTKAARELGLSRQGLLKLMERLGMTSNAGR